MMTTPAQRGDIKCPGNDPLCPCQDGDACHYKSTEITEAMTAPQTNEELDELERALRGIGRLGSDGWAGERDFVAAFRKAAPALIAAARETEYLRTRLADERDDHQKAAALYLKEIRTANAEADRWRQSHQGQARNTAAFYDDCEALKVENARLREYVANTAKAIDDYQVDPDHYGPGHLSNIRDDGNALLRSNSDRSQNPPGYLRDK